MNEKAFHKYVKWYVKNAVNRSDGTVQEVYKWLLNNKSAWKTIVFTPNPTEKSEAEQLVVMYFEGRGRNQEALDNEMPLDPSEVALEIRIQWLQTRFFVALGMAKIYHSQRRSRRRYLKEAQNRLTELRKFGFSEVDTYESSLKRYDI